MPVKTNYNELNKQLDSLMADKLTTIGSIVSGKASVNAPFDLGNLRNSIDFEVFLSEKKVRISANTEYAAIQELGGEIKPVHAKALTIPIDESAKHTSARDWKDLFVVPANDKHGAYLARTVNNRLIPMFSLVKRANIPAQPYLRPAVDESKTEILRILKSA